MLTFREKFLNALARTAAHGFLVEPFQATSEPAPITGDHGFELMQRLTEELGEYGQLRVDEIAFKCGQVSRAMQSHLERVTGQSSMLTIGTVSVKGTPLWEVDEDRLLQKKAGGSYHVWLTLPSMEIIDFTLNVSLRVQRGVRLDGVQPIFGNPDSTPNYSWEPILVGRDAARVVLGLQ